MIKTLIPSTLNSIPDGFIYRVIIYISMTIVFTSSWCHAQDPVKNLTNHDTLDTTLNTDFFNQCTLPPKDGTKPFKLDLIDQSPEELIRILSCLSRRNIIVKTPVKGRSITVYAPRKVSVSEAIQTIEIALSSHHLKVERHGHIWQIIDENERRDQRTKRLRKRRRGRKQRERQREQGHLDARTVTKTNESDQTHLPNHPKPKNVFSAHIHRVSPDTYRIDQASLPPVPHTLEQRMKSLRIIPSYNKGQVVGYKVVGLRPYSLLRTLGFRSGDVIKQINDLKINRPEHVLKIFDIVQSKEKVTVIFSRRGQEKTYHYTF